MIDSLKLYKDAKEQKISIAPGPIFSLEGKYQNFIRLNAARWDENVDAAIATLGRLAAAQLATG
jgi:DNA-binding transcriptional MocR family regulator